MELISGLIFWIPVTLFILILIRFVHWDRERSILAFLTVLLLFFIWQVLSHRHFEAGWLLALRIGGLFLSLVALILYLLKITKK
ncbi:hypothetical protein [Enterococcus diestrammenae]|uniref:Glucose uptake protein n=1 Tax=Enterococcus diestrammenae TaxID=1155073 RepID=A0ABV0EYJ7_9ENTE|nr:hypothetical protein [Enterococcus diestrammenae]KAF1294702.1 hypothetical protein BAU18_03080 [Enterococcus diestrammenae]